MEETKEGVDLLFETSWEVCNKVGGIYTVLSTKAKTLQKLYKDKLIFIGPDVWTESTPSPYFKESASLLKRWKSMAQLPYGIKVRVGRWQVPGNPIAILVKFDGLYAVKDELYSRMWEAFGVDSLHAYGDYDEACAFSHAAAIVMESLYHFFEGEKLSTIAHFNEWTTGMGLLYTRLHMPQVATVFTTHATSIGRSICGNGKDLYRYLSYYNGDQMAQELNMQSKHSLEKAAAVNADCFTTVSDITARECEQLLGRKPDIVTPNGFEPNFVPPRTKYRTCRMAARNQLIEVASALTGKQYNADTFLICTSGRAEYRNKGLDLFLDAVSDLAQKHPCRQTIAFVMVPAWCKEPRADLQLTLKSGNTGVALNEPVITHWLNNMDSDQVLSRIRGLGITNAPGSNVDIIYVPCYLDGYDGIFSLTYYQLLIGMDATVFPSYYEPWGYTPLESIAFGVPTVTTSLSGFGQWIERHFEDDFSSTGAYVAERTDTNYLEVADSISRSLKFLSCADASTLQEISQSAFATAAQATWTRFIDYYLTAFEIALSNERARNVAS